MPVSILRRTFLLFIVLVIVIQGFGHDGILVDKRHVIQKGLSQSRILSIIEDQRGFMWFGTADGLNRYDGYQIRVFKHRFNDTLSLPNNTIAGLLEDPDGNFWMATNNGVAYFNPYTEICQTLRETDSSRIAMGANRLTSCTIDEQQNVWFSTDGYGIFKINPNTFERTYYFYDKKDSLRLNKVQKLYADSKGRLWMGYFFVDTMLVYQPEKDTLLRFSINRTGGLQDASIRSYSFYEDPEKRIWCNMSDYLTGMTRLYYCNHQDDVFHSYENEIALTENNPALTKMTAITSITGSNTGDIYFSSSIGGAYRFKFGEAPRSYYVDEPGFDLPISCVYISSNNLVWLGSNGYGVEFSNPDYTDFNLINYISREDFKVVSIRAFYEDKTHYWVGGYDGLVKISKDFRSIQYIEISNVYTIAAHASDPNLLWLGSEGTGLLLLNKQSLTYSFVETRIPGRHYSKIKFIYKLFSISENQLLIGDPEGLTGYNPLTGEVTTFPFSETSAINGEMTVRSIGKDKAGNVLIGYVNGIIGRVNFDEGTVDRFLGITDLRELDYYDPVNCIYQDDDLVYWIASTLGLFKYNPKTDSLSLFTEESGLPNSHIYGLLPDDENNLWMSTNNGLSCYDIKEDVFRNFDVSDGLQNNEFNTGAYFKAQNGLLFFGGINGFNYFNPQRIKQNSTLPDIQITDIKIDGRSSRLSKDQLARHKLVIQPDEEIITFDFAGLSYINSDRNQYKYKIKELNPDWIELGNQHQITFNNKPPGIYTLEIQASNNHGLWLKEPYVLTVSILPTFYESDYFKIIAAIALIILLIFIVKWRLRQITRQRNKLQQFADQQTSNLRAINETLNNVIIRQENTTKELAASNKTKDKFLSIIGHDLMSPLSIILGFSDLLVSPGETYSPRERASFIHTINATAREVIALLTNLLQWARLQSNTINVSPAEFLVKTLISDTLLLLRGHIEAKELNLHVNVSSDLIVYADKNLVATILRNLLSNAIKFTPKGGTISLKAVSESNMVLIQIEDTGVGISDENLSHLFGDEGFTTKGTDNESGTGLGLRLVFEFVKLSGGKISVDSEPNKGTTFGFTLPRKKFQ